MTFIMRTVLRITTLLVAAALLSGCYDSSALLNEVRSDALRSQTHEINLGLYRTTMPRDANTNSLTEIELRLFGTVPQYKIAAIEEQLEADAPKLRYETLIAIRKTTAEELGEPDLGKLRARLMQVANSVIKDAPIQSIGIEKIRIADKR
jgi:HAMP domain-containing protein